MKAMGLLGYNLRRLQEHAGVSSDDLAVRAQVQVDYIERLRHGLDDCTLELLERLADILGCDVRDFFIFPTTPNTVDD
jgi:transcriptional regulator with XRE-family HTH domain